MKVFFYWLISLIVSLVILLALPPLAHADILYFKDGTKKHVGRTWKEDGHVKWKTWGITVWYTEEELERVEKTPYEDYGIGTRPIANEKIKKEIKSPVQTFSQSELQSKGFRMADGIVLKGVSKSSQSVRLVVEASKKRMVKCEAYDSNDNLIGTSTSLVKSPLHEITIKTDNKTASVKTVKCWPIKDQILTTTLQDQNTGSISLNPIAKVPRSKAKTDIKAKLAQKYAGSYSLQKTLLDSHMESYDYLISLPSNAVNNQILSKRMGSYYPHFSLIKTLYENDIKAYRELQN